MKKTPQQVLLDSINQIEKVNNLNNRDLVWKVIQHESLLDRPMDDEGLILIWEMMNRILPGWSKIFYQDRKMKIK